ncbi:MAG TPA: patatin family protein [Polyangiaceae bacterium]
MPRQKHNHLVAHVRSFPAGVGAGAVVTVWAMPGRAAIVVEGGAMRGVFSVGVLDTFLENDFNPFDLAIGTSAGACNLASHVAGQNGRNRRSYFDLMTRREFIDPRRFFARGGSIVDLDWLWRTLAEKEPLDVAAILRSPTELIVAATSGKTGEPVYFRPREHDMFDVLKGSCALPVLYRNQVRVGSETLIDGGVSDPIPVEEAYRRGARRIVVVRSRPAAYVKTNGFSTRLSAWLLRSEPAVARAVERTAERYQRAVAFLKNPPKDCRIVEVAPAVSLATRRTTQERALLERDYAVGRELGMETMERWATLSAGPRSSWPPKASNSI